MYLVHVLAVEFREKLGQALVVGLDADRAKDSLNVLGGRRGVATEAEEKIGSEMLHLECAGGETVERQWSISQSSVP